MAMHHVLYVPGLGDQRPHGQDMVPRLWQIFGVRGHFVQMHWGDKGSFAAKLERLLAKIDELAVDGNRVSLVGVSAGASMVLVAYAARPDKVAGVVCICGKINHPETVEPWRYTENPAFKASLAELQRVLPKLGPRERARIMSIRPLRDGVVPVADTLIPGTAGKVIPSVGHVFSIFWALSLGAYSFIRFLKTQAAKR